MRKSKKISNDQELIQSVRKYNINAANIIRVIENALDDHEDSVSIGGRLITNVRFADDIFVNAGEKAEANFLVDRLDTPTIRYKMEIGPE